MRHNNTIDYFFINVGRQNVNIKSKIKCDYSHTALLRKHQSVPGEGSLIERNGLKNVWIYWLDLNFDLMSCFLVVGGDGVTGQDVTKRMWSLCYYHTMTLTARLLLSMRNCPEAQRCLTSPCSVLIDFLRVVTWPVPAGCCRSITSLWRPHL